MIFDVSKFLNKAIDDGLQHNETRMHLTSLSMFWAIHGAFGEQDLAGVSDKLDARDKAREEEEARKQAEEEAMQEQMEQEMIDPMPEPVAPEDVPTEA